MYKVIWLTKFRPDVDREDVLRWWRGPHAELAAATPGMVRYVQNYWSSGLDPDTRLAAGVGRFDGHAEHWFESRATYEAAMASDEWMRTVADGPTGFDAATLVGGEIVEKVITWDAMSDGRVYPEGASGPGE